MNGGYVMLDLKDIVIENGTITISGIYNKLKELYNTKKPVVVKFIQEGSEIIAIGNIAKVPAGVETLYAITVYFGTVNTHKVVKFVSVSNDINTMAIDILEVATNA